MQQNYPTQTSVKKSVICCWPSSHPSSIISAGGFAWMQTRNTAENSSGPGCHQQPAAQPSPAWGQSEQGEELAAHPTAAWDLLCRIRPLPHLPAHFPNCRSGSVRADTCSCAPSLHPSWLKILLEEQSASTPARASGEQDALSAASPSLGNASEMCYPNLRGLHELLGGRQNNISLSCCLMNTLTLHYSPGW